MERKARDSRELHKQAGREMRPWLAHVLAWAVTLALLGGAVLAGASWRSVVTAVLIVAAYGVQTADWGRKAGPYAAVAAHVVVTRSLFLEDFAGRTRAWLGLEDEYGDEHGPRLVLYDEKGQARLALRLMDEQKERNVNRYDGRDAEVVPRGDDTDECEPTEPALVMFNQDGKISLSLSSNEEYPALTVSSRKGDAGMQPGEMWLMSPDGKQDVWRAP